MRVRILKFRVSEPEAEVILAAAAIAGLTMSELVRQAALQRATLRSIERRPGLLEHIPLELRSQR